MAIAITTTQAAQNLHLKECRHAAFARLAAYHLRLTSSATPTSKYGSPDHLNSTTLSILLIHGAAIWPAYLPRRGHLTSTSTAKAGPGRGLLYAKDSRLVRAELKAWRAAHEGREPDEEEQLLGSPLGRLLRAYLEAFV